MASMTRTGGARQPAIRRLPAVLATLLIVSITACSQPEPDEREVARAISALPGVIGVDASFTGADLGNSGDQSIDVEVANPPDPVEVEALVKSVPRALRSIEHADGYDEFVIGVQHPRVGDDQPATSVLSFGPAGTSAELATRWAAAIATSPPGAVRVRAATGQATASLSSHAPLSDTIRWALATELVGLDWTFVKYQTSVTPYVRFAPSRALTTSMASDWVAIEKSIAGTSDEASPVRMLVVEDSDRVRRVRLGVSFPDVPGPLDEGTHADAVCPIVSVVADAMPADHVLDLELHRTEDGGAQGPEDADLVDDGRGAPEWEAAYRERFPEAKPVSAPPTS